MKREKAITLISLVITIVALIILASIAIYLGLNNNGIFNRAKEAKEVTNKQTATEKINLKITTAQMNKYAEEQRMPTLKELSLILKEDDEIKYVTESSKVGAAEEYNVPSENPTSIYTRLKQYPAYEFEINSLLQLASINGIKVSSSNNDNTTWKFWKQKKGCITEQEAIELPENFNELLIEMETTEKPIYDDENTHVNILPRYSYSINITKEMLKDCYKSFGFGAGYDGYRVGGSLTINKTKAFCNEIFCFSNENLSELYQIVIYYK